MPKDSDMKSFLTLCKDSRTCKTGSRREGNQWTGLEVMMRKGGGGRNFRREDVGTEESLVVQVSEKEL